MNNLFRHIEFLLLRHDCVIVPGLGAFIVTTLPARIDREECRIYPPYRSVMFNQVITLDDGLLANSYARSLSLTFEEARQIILKDVATLVGELRNNGMVEIGKLGRISLGPEDKFLFTPSLSPNEDAQSIGFSSVSFLNLSEQQLRLQNITSDNLLMSRNQTNSHLRISRTLTKFAAVFTLLTLILVAVILYPVPRDSREQRASVVPVEALIATTKKQIVIQDSVTPAEPLEDETIQISNLPSLPSHYLIVGTFTTREEAERYALKHSTPEYPLEAVPSRKLTRVSVAMSDNKEELIKKLNSAQIINRFPHAWIWTASE